MKGKSHPNCFARTCFVNYHGDIDVHGSLVFKNLGFFLGEMLINYM
jgi:hypothetical protein